jgi:hypothetical protein
VNIRIFAIDKSGNTGDYSVQTYSVKKLPELPKVTATPGDMRMELTVLPVSGGVRYKLCRASGAQDRHLAEYGGGRCSRIHLLDEWE